jgi:hypothetical protein
MTDRERIIELELENKRLKERLAQAEAELCARSSTLTPAFVRNEPPVG